MDVRGWQQEVGALACGVPPGRIGYGSGPLTALRRARHRRLRRTLTICLLDYGPTQAPLAPAQAFWINQRSGIWRAVVNDPEGADLVWVFCEDPLTPPVRASLATTLAGLPVQTPILNRLETYDAYHRDDCFPRLAAAGVRVPRSTFGPADLGRTRVVYKASGTQGGAKEVAGYDGPRPGYRAFSFEDGRGADGRTRRYRAVFLAGAVLSETVIVSEHWEARLSTLVEAELTYELTPHEVAQVRLIAQVLGLDYFAVDFLRRRGDALPVFVDVNVYPTNQLGGWVAGDHGQWHFFDLPERLGRPWPGGRPYWDVADESLARAVARPHVSAR